MRTATAAVACACVALFATIGASGAAAGVQFGANDDTGKYSADGGAVFFSQMAATGLKQNVMTVRWKPSDPTNIPDQAALDLAVPIAVAAGIEVVFAVYPYPPSELEAGGISHLAFAAWLDTLARAYPQVTTYIVGNEPNLNTFWRPQGTGAGRVLAAAQFGRFLAAGYDALKTVSPEITVLGVGSSPRGERAPGATGKSSPVHFLKALGDWYRASLRPTPIMDGFSYHPYPNPSDFTVPFTFTYGWPNASVQELQRIKQALWDAFDGTPQPTTLNGLELYLDEVGWQVDTSFQPGYTDAENVRVTSEETQASIYGDLVRYVVCDPDVAQPNFFGYYDERSRLGWQSALRRNDGSARASNAAVAAAIAETGGECRGLPRSWSPLRKPVGAAVVFKPASGLRAGVRSLGFVPTAAEDVLVTAGIVQAATPAGELVGLLGRAGSAVANRRSELAVSGALEGRKRYVLAVALTARSNPRRVSLFKSRPFTVAAGFRPGQPCQPARAVEYAVDGFVCTNLTASKLAQRPRYQLLRFRR
ncbi:MAG: hypothetical protein H0V94_10905 [Actinobacteria bacterium]|nr:hypothetical protein [Actinomycetota bacterium]